MAGPLAIDYKGFVSLPTLGYPPPFECRPANQPSSSPWSLPDFVVPPHSRAEVGGFGVCLFFFGGGLLFFRLLAVNLRRLSPPLRATASCQRRQVCRATLPPVSLMVFRPPGQRSRVLGRTQAIPISGPMSPSILFSPVRGHFSPFLVFGHISGKMYPPPSSLGPLPSVGRVYG